MNLDVSPSVAIGAIALLGALANAVLGVRVGRCDTASALARFMAALAALVVGVFVFRSAIVPVVGYGLLCLSLVSVFLFDLLREERARRRRVASLTPRPPADAVPTCWVAIAGLSLLMLGPYVLLGEERPAAVMVGICALVMVGIAGRIASAPMQLEGHDLVAERVRTRASRSLRAGMTAVLAIGSIFVFVAFENAELPIVLPLQHAFLLVSFLGWLGLWAWVMLYWRHLGGLSLSTS